MEHEVPKNITSFQFRLVGDMTLKQFAYLAVGSSFAYLSFLTLIPAYPLLGWAISIPAVALGAAFAFLPIADRPLDHWLVAYLKAVYSPTKRIWRKNGRTFNQEPLFNSRYILYTQPPTVSSPLPPPTPFLPPPPFTPDGQLPSEEELVKTVALAKQAQSLQMQIIETEKKLNQTTAGAFTMHTPPQDQINQINAMLDNLQRLVTQASAIKRQLAEVTHTEEETPKQKIKVKVLPPQKTEQKKLTLTSLPNVINGLVLDATGNYLEGVVVVIYNQEGMPVRALKTNKLGQFTGSTPLPNESYTIELEKENLNFDVLQIDLAGAVLPPLTVSAKKITA